MRLLAKIVIGLVVLAVAGYFALPLVQGYWKARHKPVYRQAAVARGDVTEVVSSTGTIQPVLRVTVGTFVSGPIQRLLVNFNDRVTKGQLMAKIDPRIYQSQVAQAEASLATRKAEVKNAEAMLEQARQEERRARALFEMSQDYISETELDQVKYSRISAEAQLEVAKAAVKQAAASLENAQTNLGYTDIKAPVDGIVIDRKIDEGQTLAAQFQTPELFVVAPKMEEKMHIFASVDEADMGVIREAQKRGNKVEFTVAGYLDDLFEGKVYQIRLNPTTTQNVVTYPVVVEAPNPDLKLLPGMTANLSFHLDKHADVLKVPNAALRFYPKPEEVRPEDRKLLEGADFEAQSQQNAEDQEESAAAAEKQPAAERAAAGKARHRRHVWVAEGDFLRAVEVVTGLSDTKFTELVSGDLKEGQELVTRVGPPGP